MRSHRAAALEFKFLSLPFRYRYTMDASSGRRHQLDALADPTRRAILELLRERPLTAGEIAARFSQQRPAISKHLTLLRTTGWLAESRDRQRRIYSLRNDAVVVVVDWARRLGEGSRDHDVQRVGEPRHDGANSRRGVDISSREFETSDLKHKASAGMTGHQSNEPGTANPSVRSSFELIFD